MSPAAETGAKAREQRGSPADDRLAAVNPVVFHFNGLGDRLMALPALRALACLFAGRLALIGGAGDRVRFYADVPLREAHEVFCPVVDGGRRFDAAELAGKVGACDLLISLNTWPSPDYERLLAHWPGAASLGFSRSFRSRLRVDHERHACDNYFDLVQALSPSARLTAFAQPPALPEPEAPVGALDPGTPAAVGAPAHAPHRDPRRETMAGGKMARAARRAPGRPPRSHRLRPGRGGVSNGNDAARPAGLFVAGGAAEPRHGLGRGQRSFRGSRLLPSPRRGPPPRTRGRAVRSDQPAEVGLPIRPAPARHRRKRRDGTARGGRGPGGPGPAGRLAQGPEEAAAAKGSAAASRRQARRPTTRQAPMYPLACAPPSGRMPIFTCPRSCLK